jgi:hypothetical protein
MSPSNLEVFVLNPMEGGRIKGLNWVALPRGAAKAERNSAPDKSPQWWGVGVRGSQFAGTQGQKTSQNLDVFRRGRQHHNVASGLGCRHKIPHLFKSLIRDRKIKWNAISTTAVLI